ncbi:MAG TPA: hypothetical protein VMV08_00525 [Gaiellaceae bacterium]|nr:hypothetical protein [Gaiellaceae bacterium]
MIVFVFSVLALVGYTLFKLSPFAEHADRYRATDTGKRLSPGPRLD